MSELWFCERTDERGVRISGSDNLSFLQTKLTADTRRWRMTGGGYGVATDINGRVLFDGTFGLLDAEVVAVFPADLFEAALEHIDRYVIMEDVECHPLDGSVFELPFSSEESLGLDPDREEPTRAESVDFGAGPALAFRAAGSTEEAPRLLVLGPATLGQWLRVAGFEERSVVDMNRREVAAGVPRIGRDFFAGKTIPVEAGLWNGVSLSKGCYLGQEILERLFSRGSAARRLVHFSVEGPEPSAGDGVVSDGRDAGAVTSSATTAAGARGLAYIKRSFADAPIHLSDGRALTRIGYVGGEWPEQP
jgi:folate-binding protein YgfZ